MDRVLARRLSQRLERLSTARLRRLRFTLMPDFFVDHIIRLSDWRDAGPRLQAIHDRGGGSWPGVRQEILQGGNAANTAIALARLGARARLVGKTDKVGLAILQHFAAPVGLDISGVKSNGTLATTTALEFEGTGANVMLSQPGSVETFGPDDLDGRDWRNVRDSDVVAVMNWALNRKGGTRLAASVFREARAAGATTFLDLADPSARKEEFPRLRRAVLRSGHLDAWGLNENELRCLGGVESVALPRAQELALFQRLADEVRPRLDLHTRRWAATRNGAETTVVDAAPVPTRRRSTGAGDAWNAGNLVGQALGLPPDERLLLGHLVAAYYISSETAQHPDLRDLRRFARWTVRQGG